MRNIQRFLTCLGLICILYSSSIIHEPFFPVFGETNIKPSKNTSIFFNTVGDIRITIEEPGVAIKIFTPREFLRGRSENETSFVFSDISNDYYYYSVKDLSLHYPYNENAPYSIEIWNPPKYTSPTCVGKYYNFTAPKFVLMEELKAPNIAGLYNFSLFIAQNMVLDKWNRLVPDFPENPSTVLQVHVNMREDSGHIYGYIWDGGIDNAIKTKGVVYAIEETSGVKGRAFVNRMTGFFNITGLYEGSYRIEGSAGLFPDTGFAYSPTIRSPIIVNRGLGTNVGTFILNRGAIINGTIEYVDEYNTPIKPLESPYLQQLGIQILNYTVEAYDLNGRIVASQTFTSQNNQEEKYSLIIRNGGEHISYPSLGSEYSGFGEGSYLIRVWVFGFIQPEEERIVVTIPAFSGYFGTMVNSLKIHLPYGGIISGKIKLTNGLTNQLETPRQGEIQNFGTRYGTKFGGNILVELYNGKGVLRGFVLLNRTLANGTSSFSDYSNGENTELLRFHILGFSDYYNQSYRGNWKIGSFPGSSPWDYGLEADTYFIKVWMRGYGLKESNPPSIILRESGSAVNSANVTVTMVRGGGIASTISSMTTKPGTRHPQALARWRFFDYCPYPYIRLYVYSEEKIVGYADNQLKPGVIGVSDTTVKMNFTGHNWPLYKLISLGYRPSWLDKGTYILKAFTWGYVQTRDENLYIPISTVGNTGFSLQLGSNIIVSTVLMSNNLFVSLPENTTVEIQTFREGSLEGVEIRNAESGSSSFRFTIHGFFGRGHFFFVDRNGKRWFDYGLDTGNYTVFIPDFRHTGSGIERIFYQETEVSEPLLDLQFGVSVYFHLERMIKIFGVINGETGIGPPFTIPLVWVSVTADSETRYSYDGDYWLHIQPPPQGETKIVTLTFDIPGYNIHLDSFQVTRGTNIAGYNPPILTQSGEEFS